MNLRRAFPTLALVAVAAALPAALPAIAAEPSSGSVSNASPRAEWSGTAGGYGTSIVADVNGEFLPVCENPNCDVFTLEVADSADLSVSLTTSNGGGFTTVEVEKPDGTKVYDGGADGQDTTTIKIKKAPTGSYIVRTQTNQTPEDAGYTGVAVLGAAPAPAAPTGGAPAPGSSPPPSAAPAPPAAQPGASLSLKTRSASARKSGKRLKLAVSTTSPVTNLKVTLRKGSKAVATGSLAKLEKTGTVALKLKRKLRAGAYKVTLSATDSRGATVGATAKLTVKK